MVTRSGLARPSPTLDPGWLLTPRSLKQVLDSLQLKTPSCSGGAAGLLLGQVLEEEKELHGSGWTCLVLWLLHTVLACDFFSVALSRED